MNCTESLYFQSINISGEWFLCELSFLEICLANGKSPMQLPETAPESKSSLSEVERANCPMVSHTFLWPIKEKWAIPDMRDIAIISWVNR